MYLDPKQWLLTPNSTGDFYPSSPVSLLFLVVYVTLVCKDFHCLRRLFTDYTLKPFISTFPSNHNLTSKYETQYCRPEINSLGVTKMSRTVYDGRLIFTLLTLPVSKWSWCLSGMVSVVPCVILWDVSLRGGLLIVLEPIYVIEQTLPYKVRCATCIIDRIDCPTNTPSLR